MNEYNHHSVRKSVSFADVDVGVKTWVHHRDPMKRRYFNHRENLAVAGLIASNYKPEFAAWLVDRGYVEARLFYSERYAECINGLRREMILALIQTADGCRYDLLGDREDINAAILTLEFDPSHYRVVASRCGHLSDDDIAVRVGQLVTLDPELLTDMLAEQRAK